MGYHAFHYIHAPWGAGNHQVSVYAIGINGSCQPDGQNPQLPGSPKSTGNLGCTGLVGNPLEWCQNNSSYWTNRQADTIKMFNDNIYLTINHSYGGLIAQLYNNDRSVNLIDEHGGAGIQLSLWEYATQTTNDICDNLWNYIYNPIQARGLNCDWHSTTNDVGLLECPIQGCGVWNKIYKSNPGQFNRKDPYTGLNWDQKAELFNGYAKITYHFTNNGSQGQNNIHNQEMPAIHTSNGIKTKGYYRNSSGVLQTINLTSTETFVDLSTTKKWWAICNSNDTRCITVATNSTSAIQKVAFVAFPQSGYATPIGSWSLSQGQEKTAIIYIFPYKYNQTIPGTSQTPESIINSLFGQ